MGAGEHVPFSRMQRQGVGPAMLSLPQLQHVRNIGCDKVYGLVVFQHKLGEICVPKEDIRLIHHNPFFYTFQKLEDGNKLCSEVQTAHTAGEILQDSLGLLEVQPWRRLLYEVHRAIEKEGLIVFIYLDLLSRVEINTIGRCVKERSKGLKELLPLHPSIVICVHLSDEIVGHLVDIGNHVQHLSLLVFNLLLLCSVLNDRLASAASGVDLSGRLFIHDSAFDLASSSMNLALTLAE
mmetsp:Transcript_28935/g.46262  ORF Transcript_28935/g.46262 Transcript_28935/m.46262 type:complete len:237 (-) Transcript_28935:446-1156(-)